MSRATISEIDTRRNLAIARNMAHNIAPCIRVLSLQWSHLNATKVNQTCEIRAILCTNPRKNLGSEYTSQFIYYA